jgi:hypothetical protein
MGIQDDSEFGLGNALDIKTSIVLIVITFLATQSAELLKVSRSGFWHIFPIASAVCLCCAAVFSVAELIPKNYSLRMAPDEFFRWAAERRDSHRKSFEPDPDLSAAREIRDIQVKRLIERYEINSAINNRKSRWLKLSFYFTASALALNLISVLRIAMAHSV